MTGERRGIYKNTYIFSANQGLTIKTYNTIVELVLEQFEIVLDFIHILIFTYSNNSDTLLNAYYELGS